MTCPVYIQTSDMAGDVIFSRYQTLFMPPFWLNIPVFSLAHSVMIVS